MTREDKIYMYATIGIFVVGVSIGKRIPNGNSYLNGFLDGVESHQAITVDMLTHGDTKIILTEEAERKFKEYKKNFWRRETFQKEQ